MTKLSTLLIATLIPFEIIATPKTSLDTLSNPFYTAVELYAECTIANDILKIHILQLKSELKKLRQETKNESTKDLTTRPMATF